MADPIDARSRIALAPNTGCASAVSEDSFCSSTLAEDSGFALRTTGNTNTRIGHAVDSIANVAFADDTAGLLLSVGRTPHADIGESGKQLPLVFDVAGLAAYNTVRITLSDYTCIREGRQDRRKVRGRLRHLTRMSRANHADRAVAAYSKPLPNESLQAGYKRASYSCRNHRSEGSLRRLTNCPIVL